MQVRGAAAATAEREARALAALEKSGAERNAAVAARERLLQEREEAVSRCSMECRANRAMATASTAGQGHKGDTTTTVLLNEALI